MSADVQKTLKSMPPSKILILNQRAASLLSPLSYNLILDLTLPLTSMLALMGVLAMIIDDDTIQQLVLIDDELMQLCKQLNDKHDIEISSCLIPLVDDLTHLLIEAGKNKLQ